MLVGTLDLINPRSQPVGPTSSLVGNRTCSRRVTSSLLHDLPGVPVICISCLFQVKEHPFDLQLIFIVLYFTTTLENYTTLVRSKMMKLELQNGLHIPNYLAAFAAIMLLLSSTAELESSGEVYSSGTELTPTSKTSTDDDDTDTTEYKSVSLNLGLLLFRRG